MLVTTIALAAMATPNFVVTKNTLGRSLPANVQFYEIYTNPPGSGDENSGLESIVVRGPANMSLNNYAIVAVENEHGSGGANDIGTVDMIVPLDGYETNSDGICVIRDLNASGNLGNFTPADPTSGVNRFAFQWQTVNSSYGGNSLENEGSNYFIVRDLNPNLEQEIDGASKGTALDIDHDGVLDYLEPTPPTGWVQPWNNAVSDAVFIPYKDKALGTNPSTQQVDYTTSVSATTHISVARHTSSTPDMFFRLNDTLALVSDILNPFNVVDTSEVYFSDDTTTSHVQYYSGSYRVQVGYVGYFSVRHSVTSTVYTH